MQSKSLIIVLAILMIGGASWLFLEGFGNPSVAEWGQADEVAADEDEFYGDAIEGAGIDGDEDRSEFAGDPGEFPDDPDAARPLITVKGRVVDVNATPVAGAKVNLSAQGRGRTSRISKDVVTEGDGTFAFAGKGFSRMWVTLRVSHPEYAIASAFKALEDAAGEIDMGPSCFQSMQVARTIGHSSVARTRRGSPTIRICPSGGQ